MKTKPELVAAIASTAAVTKADAERVIDAVVRLAHDCIARSEEFTIPNLAKFVVRDQPPREVRNPLTGETRQKPASKRIGIKLSKPFKAALG